MSIKKLNNDLDALETHVSIFFSDLLNKQKEIVIFDEDDLEHDTPDDYLECRNDISGDVFDVHPLKVNEFGIHCIDASGSGQRHTLRFSDLSSVQDRINLCELMENVLV